MQWTKSQRGVKMLQVKTGTFLIHLPLQNLSSEPSIPLQDLIKRNHAVQSSFQMRSYLRPSLPSDPCHVLLPLLASCNDVTFQDQVFPAEHLYITQSTSYSKSIGNNSKALLTWAISKPRPSPSRIFVTGTHTFSNVISACPWGASSNPKTNNGLFICTPGVLISTKIMDCCLCLGAEKSVFPWIK